MFFRRSIHTGQLVWKSGQGKKHKNSKKKCFNLKLNSFFICALASFNLRYIVPYIETYVKFMLFACLLNHTLHFNYWWIYRKIFQFSLHCTCIHVWVNSLLILACRVFQENCYLQIHVYEKFKQSKHIFIQHVSMLSQSFLSRNSKSICHFQCY